MWLLLAAAIAVYFVALGNAAIWDANEAFYVETPREMLAAHDLFNPAFNYLPRFNKPVLSYWIVAGLYKAFGMSVAVQRFGIAVGALVIIGCAFVLARSGTKDATIRDGAAVWAAAGLAAAPRLVMFARRIFIDIWLTAFMAMTLTFFALSEQRPERRRLYLALMYVSVGFGVLTKGPVAIALPALAFGVYLAVTRQLRRIKEMMVPLGIVIVAAIVVPWYAVLYHEHGWTYIKSFLMTENVERYTSGVGVRLSRGPWFYAPVVFSDSFPISMLLPVAAVAAWRERTRLQTLLWCWIASIVGFFSLSAGKQDLYVLPIVPAVAALGGLAIERGLSDDRWRRWLTWTLSATGVLITAAGAGILWLFETSGRVYVLDAALDVGAVAVAGGMVVVLLGVMRRPAPAAVALLTAVIAVDWLFVGRVLPEFERYKPVPVFTRTLDARLQPGDAVAEYVVALPSMVFYLGRHVDQYFDEPSFVRAVLNTPRLYAIVSDEDYVRLAPRIGARTCVIEHRPTFDVKLSRMLAREPLPELLLIANTCK